MSSVDVRAIAEDELRNEPAPAVKQEFRVFLAEKAFDRAVARGTSDLSREIGGVLVGEVLKDKAGPYLRIETTVDALHAEEKGAELTFTHATWEHINKEMDTQHKGKKVVGWYHTHPGFGVFLSDRDQFIHKSFFDLPFQVAFVYDPKSREHGMFTWHDNEVRRARRYWVGEREQIWDAARVSDEARAKKESDKKDDASRGDGSKAAEPPLFDAGGSMAAFIGIGIVLLALGVFGGHWWGSSSAKGVLVQAQVEVAKAKNEGMQLAIASLQSDLVGILRATLGDEALRKPLQAAVAEMDAIIASLDPQVPAPAPAPAPATGSAAGSAAPAPAPADPRAKEIAQRLRAARDKLVLLAQDRNSSQAVLAQLEMVARRGGQQREDLSHDVTEQRSGLGALYAELAADVAKGGDKARARRLLSVAAHLDPGNRARYEQQLRSFDKAATLPRDVGAAQGSGGTK